MTYYEFFECFFGLLSTLKEAMTISSPHEILDLKETTTAETSAAYAKDLNSLLLAMHNVTVDECLTRIILPPIKMGLSKYDFAIPKKNEIDKASAAVFCPHLFLSLPLNELYQVLCSMYTERIVIFISSDVHLLTFSMYVFLSRPRFAFCTLLSPFRWEHILIPVMADEYLEYLDTPFPCIMGLPLATKQAEDLINSIREHEALMVFLDTGKVKDYVPEGKSQSPTTIPDLNNLKKTIEPEYKKIRGRRGNVKAGVEKILATIENCMRRAILNYLPTILPRKINDVLAIDLERVKRKVIGKVKPADEQFAELHCCTQMFAQYLDKLDVQMRKRLSFT